MKFCQVNKYLNMLEMPFLAGLINFVMAENRGQLPAQELNLYFWTRAEHTYRSSGFLQSEGTHVPEPLYTLVSQGLPLLRIWGVHFK